jgi:DNA-binding transcriptional LysR family regulator
MRPTPRAMELAVPICDALQRLQLAFERPKDFDPKTTARLLTIGATDNCDFAIAPAFSALRKAALLVDFCVVGLSRNALVARLDEAEVDLAIGSIPTVPKRFSSLPLYRERFVCVADRQRRGDSNSMSLERFVATPHIHVWHENSAFIDEALEARGLARRIAFELPNFAVVPFVIEGTDLIAVVGERVAHRFSALPWIAVYDLPLEQTPWTVSVLWGGNGDHDPANMWLRTQLQEACRTL